MSSGDIRRVVRDEIAEEALELWLAKNEDYGEQLFDFDVRAQALEINRKNGKIKDALWHGKQLKFETVEEVLFDMIGHCYIAIARLRLEGDPADLSDKDVHRLLNQDGDEPCSCGSNQPSAWCRCQEEE